MSNVIHFPRTAKRPYRSELERPFPTHDDYEMFPTVTRRERMFLACVAMGYYPNYASELAGYGPEITDRAGAPVLRDPRMQRLIRLGAIVLAYRVEDMDNGRSIFGSLLRNSPRG